MTTESTARISFIPLGGPSAVVEIGSVRFVIDPTFDAAGDYQVGSRVLTKTSDAAVHPRDVGRVDAVLLSHDQHPDNLDRAGREFLRSVPVVLTTTAAAGRLDATCRGLTPWESTTVGEVTVTAVPAQHGPDGTEAVTGPVIGFVLASPTTPTIYVSGDNASLSVVGSIAERVPDVAVAVLFAGAARTPLVDGFLTLTSEEAVEAARILGEPRVLPVHTDGWAHFTEDSAALAAAFARAGLAELLLDSAPGRRTVM